MEIKRDGKLSFSIKQASDFKSLRGAVKRKLSFQYDELNRRIGAITGILLDDTHKVSKRQKIERTDRE